MNFDRFPAMRAPTVVAAERAPLFSDRGLALRSILGFWAFYIATVLVRALLGPEGASAMSFRIASAIIGLVLTSLIYLLLRLLAVELVLLRRETLDCSKPHDEGLCVKIISPRGDEGAVCQSHSTCMRG